jgi:hypothetical protein
MIRASFNRPFATREEIDYIRAAIGSNPDDEMKRARLIRGSNATWSQHAE